MKDKSNELFLSPESIRDNIQELIDDVPDLDGGDFYTNKSTGRKYGSWRTKVDPKTENYLKGFKDGLEAAHKLIGGQGGSTIWGLAHIACPYGLIKYSERMKEAGSYSFGGTCCTCDKCLADIKRVDDANPRMCDCDAEYIHPDCIDCNGTANCGGKYLVDCDNPSCEHCAAAALLDIISEDLKSDDPKTALDAAKKLLSEFGPKDTE